MNKGYCNENNRVEAIIEDLLQVSLIVPIIPMFVCLCTY